MSTVDAAPPAAADAPAPEGYGRLRLAAGLVGRSWLWFIVGCLLVTFVPMLFGWRPYVIESGSMEPRIHVGDVVLAAPVLDRQDLLGRVTVFESPVHPGETITHRVVRFDGSTMVTKGDANASEDSSHITMASVRGIGRLLVKWVGLPVIWVRTGQWLWLLVFLASLWLAAFALVRDHEPDDDLDGLDGGDPGDGAGSPGGGTSEGDDGAPGGRRGWGRSWAVRAVPVVVGAVVLGTPSSMAAFAATTASTGNTWSVPSYLYSTEVKNLSPYLYWRLDENGQVVATAADSSGNGHDGEFNPKGNPANFDWLQNGGALVTDVPDNAIGLTKSSSCINTASTTATAAPSTFSLVIWFKAAVGYAFGGKIIGFENPRTGVATPPTGAYDRMLYMDGNGRVWFGVNNGGIVGISSGTGLNDGTWHMAAATFGAAGMRLYVDGVLVSSNATTTANAYNGFWRVGCGNLAGWAGDWTGPNPPPAGTTPASNETFMGGLDEASVFPTQLTTQQVEFLYWIR